MKVKLFLMIALSGIAVTAQAQSGDEVCSIVYSYDAAGNRIQREYKCKRSWSPGESTDTRRVFTTLYPNPTTGVFTGEFSEPASEASFIITAMSGAVVLQHELSQTASSVTFDISAQVPGNYLLHVWALGLEESYTISKIQ